MRQRSFLVSLVVLSAAALALIPAGSAGAGGWSWLEADRRHYLPGQPAVARAGFSAATPYGGRLADGPYYAYLLPQEQWIIDPPGLPAGAIPLGRVSFKQPRLADAWFDTIALLRFVVPDVPSGRYGIGICNDPCSVSGVGDLGGGAITVVHTPLEGKLMHRLDRLGLRLADFRRDLRGSERAGERVRAKLADARQARSDLTVRLDALRARLATAAARIREPEPRVNPLVPAAAGIGLVLGGLAIARRRRGRTKRPPEAGSPADVAELPRVREPALPRR